MKHYVAGFLFDKNFKRVVLIEKQRPLWQKGRLNGVGGHIEKGEKPVDAMEREFFEEAGLRIPASQWHHFAYLTVADTAEIFFFWASDYVDMARSMTDEQIGIFNVDALPEQTMRNLRWLIPMALDTDLQTPCKIHDLAGHKA